MRWPRARLFTLATLSCLATLATISASQEPDFTTEQVKQFLLTAKVVNYSQTNKGITNPWRLTLSDGRRTHDAAFQNIDERRLNKALARRTELHFVDSYKYDIAGYVLAELLGMDDMVPVTVERKWQGRTGALSWWVPSTMDEAERLSRKMNPPDPEAWAKQLHKIRVFNQLVYDTDFNQTNLLITEDWKLWRIDFTRAFRRHKELLAPEELVRCDRQLLERLRKLDAIELEQRTKGYLTKSEVQAVLARREMIVTHFQKLIEEKGENAVLY